MEEIQLGQNDELVMKLLHYFITEKGYNPIILHGAKDEIWLENMDSNYGIIRIVSSYIHNNEQLNFDLYKTKQIVKKIKKTTLSFKVNTLSLFVNLGDNVKLDDVSLNNIDIAKLTNIKDLKKYSFIMEEFPTITKDTKFKEEGLNLFFKITEEIAKKNEETGKKAEDVFKKKTPIITNLIILINVLIFAMMHIFGNGSLDNKTLVDFGSNVRELVLNGEYYRLISSLFIHIGIIHLVCNMYCLYVVGSEIESFYGKAKYIIIYLLSGLCGSLLSILTTENISAGASGAIFGLFGSLLYFGYHYRVYLGSVLKSQVIPLIIFNLALGFLIPGVDIGAHIGGLIGGVLVSKAVGVKYKSTKSDIINGIILSIIFISFLTYLAFFSNII